MDSSRQNVDGIEIETAQTKFKRSKSDSKKQAQHPIELEYWFILPALRRNVAQTLKDGGLKQKHVASILGITEAGVSQYLKGSRGVLKSKEADKEIQFPSWLKEEINNSCKEILEDTEDHSIFLKEINRLLGIIRGRPADFLCMLHNEYGIVDNDCDVCLNT